MSPQEQVAAAEKNLERLLQWVGRLDTKSSILLGIDTAMLGVLISTTPKLTAWVGYTIASAVTSVALLGLGFWFIYRASYPQIKGPAKSLLFFGSIATNSFNEYCQAFSSQSSTQYLNDVLEQCHRNSEVLDRKFLNLKRAYRIILIALVPWGVTIVLFKFS